MCGIEINNNDERAEDLWKFVEVCLTSFEKANTQFCGIFVFSAVEKKMVNNIKIQKKSAEMELPN